MFIPAQATTREQSDALIAVVGGGIMGALSAIAASQAGLSVLWFGPVEQGRQDGADARNYALGPASVALLQRLGVWQAVAASSIPVTRMEVYSGDSRVDLSASDAGADFLSTMILHRALLDGLEDAVRFHPRIQRIAMRPDRMTAFPDRVELGIDGRKWSVRLAVGADGARSWVRQQAGILWGQRDYGQQGVVAGFTTSHPHGGVAAQWFDDGEILALLPLPDPHRVSMVWSTSRQRVTEPSALADLIRRVQECSRGRFGELTLVDTPVSAPLRMMLTNAQSALRTVLVGDAAHTVHPLAGYGLNLGIQDLLALEPLFREHIDDPGSAAVIHAYEKSRHRRVRRVQWGLDALQRLVTANHPTINRVTRLGMRAVADIGPLRQLLIRQALMPS